MDTHLDKIYRKFHLATTPQVADITQSDLAYLLMLVEHGRMMSKFFTSKAFINLLGEGVTDEVVNDAREYLQLLEK